MPRQRSSGSAGSAPRLPTRSADRSYSVGEAVVPSHLFRPADRLRDKALRANCSHPREILTSAQMAARPWLRRGWLALSAGRGDGNALFQPNMARATPASGLRLYIMLGSALCETRGGQPPGPYRRRSHQPARPGWPPWSLRP